MDFQANNFISYQLIQESYQCNFKVVRLSDTQVTITWDIPKDRNNQSSNISYNGLIIVASDTDIDVNPDNGTRYIDDPTTDSNLHVGDKVGTGLVVFSLYDNVVLNTCTISSSFEPFLYAYIVDRHNRYIPFPIVLSSRNVNEIQGLTQSAPGYSLLQIMNKTITDLIAYEPIPTLSTETLGFKYNFPGTDVVYTYNPLGLTYQGLIDGFNTFAKQQTADYVNNAYYNQGIFWLHDNIVLEWSGTQYIPHLTYVQTTQPHLVVDNTIWQNTTTNAFYNRTNPNWDLITVIKKPSLLPTTNTYWYDGSVCYKWEGNIWVAQPTITQTTEPGIPLYDQLDGQYWIDPVTSILYHIEQGRLVKKTAITSVTDPLLLSIGAYWVDVKNKIVKKLTNSGWVTVTSTFGNNCAADTITTAVYYDTNSHQLFDIVLDAEITNFVTYPTDPLLLPIYSLWFNDDTNVLKILTSTGWVTCTLNSSATNPLITDEADDGTVWVNGSVIKVKQGTWETIAPILSPTDPNIVMVGDYIYVTTTNEVYKLTAPSVYTLQTKIDALTDPTIPMVGEGWLDTGSLSIWNGLSYVPVAYVLTDPKPVKGFLWYKPSTDQLFVWNGSAYVIASPKFEMIWDGGLKLVNNIQGSQSIIKWTKYAPIIGTQIDYVQGVDSVSSQRTQNEQNIGGNENDITERHNMIEYIKRTLGAPTNVVELTEMQLNDCIDSALRTLRLYASVSTDKKVMLMELVPHQSTYVLSNRRLGYHKITEILQIHRLPSSFLTAVGSQQVYGQLVLQQLYRAGSFDLLSYHLISSYIELMERMFASKITYVWKERTRELTLYNTTGRKEITLIECTVERTENDLFTDRRTEDWIKRWSVAEARERLSEIRGKFSTLPGAGGGISLNSADLHQKAQEEKERCIMEIKMYIVDSPEYFGGHSTMIMG